MEMTTLTTRQAAAFKAACTKKLNAVDAKVSTGKMTTRAGAAYKAAATRRLNAILA